MPDMSALLEQAAAMQQRMADMQDDLATLSTDSDHRVLPSATHAMVVERTSAPRNCRARRSSTS